MTTRAQKEALNKDTVSPDLEGMASLNSLPDVSLRGATDNTWEDEDGIVRSGENSQKDIFSLLVPSLFTFKQGVLSLMYNYIKPT